MKMRKPYRLPPKQEEEVQHVRRLEWWTLFWLATITVVMYLSMGSSQAMKAAWIEDVLSLIPPAAILIGLHFKDKNPSQEFPFGFARAVTISFLISTFALLALGAYIFYDSAMSLVRMEHPSIGTVKVFGQQFWMGWVMIAALLYSAVPPVFLGRLKLKPSHTLYNDALHADASMNKADWMTALAGVVGIIGIGFGFWWADAVAAMVISFDILKDGYRYTKKSFYKLLDYRPSEVGSEKPLDLESKIMSCLCAEPWIADAAVRMRPEGETITAHVFAIPQNGTNDLPGRIEATAKRCMEVDWRIHDVLIVPVNQI